MIIDRLFKPRLRRRPKNSFSPLFLFISAIVRLVNTSKHAWWSRTPTMFVTRQQLAGDVGVLVRPWTDICVIDVRPVLETLHARVRTMQTRLNPGRHGDCCSAGVNLPLHLFLFVLFVVVVLFCFLKKRDTYIITYWETHDYFQFLLHSLNTIKESHKCQGQNSNSFRRHAIFH